MNVKGLRKKSMFLLNTPNFANFKKGELFTLYLIGGDRSLMYHTSLLRHCCHKEHSITQMELIAKIAVDIAFVACREVLYGILRKITCTKQQVVGL